MNISRIGALAFAAVVAVVFTLTDCPPVGAWFGCEERDTSMRIHPYSPSVFIAFHVDSAVDTGVDHAIRNFAEETNVRPNLIDEFPRHTTGYMMMIRIIYSNYTGDESLGWTKYYQLPEGLDGTWRLNYSLCMDRLGRPTGRCRMDQPADYVEIFLNSAELQGAGEWLMNHTVTHEMGHAFGMGHRGNPACVMCQTLMCRTECFSYRRSESCLDELAEIDKTHMLRLWP